MRVSDAESCLTNAEELQTAASSIFTPLKIRVPRERRFQAVVKSSGIGSVVVAHIKSTPAMVDRDLRCIGSTDPDLVKVTLHRSGTMTVAQDERSCRVRPGDLVAYETSRPYRLIGTDVCDIVVIGIPRPMLGASADLISRRTAVALPSDEGVRAVIAGFFAGVADNLDTVAGLAGVRLADALVSLVISSFTEVSLERAGETADLADRILAYALANLADPALSADLVARRHGISTRYLHKVLERRGIGFAAWVRQERLRRIRRDLLDPALAHRTIAAIAVRWGVSDAGHLSRGFRTEFGQTAAELRRTISSG